MEQKIKLNPDKIIPALNNELLEAKEEKKDDPEPKHKGSTDRQNFIHLPSR